MELKYVIVESTLLYSAVKALHDPDAVIERVLCQKCHYVDNVDIILFQS